MASPKKHVALARHEGKFVKPGGEKLTAFETQISQFLQDLETSNDLKSILQELSVNEAKEMEVGGKNIVVLYVPPPQLRNWQKTHQRVVRELEKKLSGRPVIFIAKRRMLPKPTRKTVKLNQVGKKVFSTLWLYGWLIDWLDFLQLSCSLDGLIDWLPWLFSIVETAAIAHPDRRPWEYAGGYCLPGGDCRQADPREAGRLPAHQGALGQGQPSECGAQGGCVCVAVQEADGQGGRVWVSRAHFLNPFGFEMVFALNLTLIFSFVRTWTSVSYSKKKIGAHLDVCSRWFSFRALKVSRPLSRQTDQEIRL